MLARISDDVIRLLAELQASTTVQSNLMVIAGEAFVGYSLDTPSTTSRCQAALAAAMDDDASDDAHVDGGVEVEALPLPPAHEFK